MEAGANSGTVAAYAALELIRENGFRDFSDADIERFYGDLGFKGSAVEVHLSLTAAQSNAGVVAASPIDVLDVGWNRTFTSPQDTDLEVLMPTLSGKVQATDTLSFSGIAYYRKFKSRVVDGNLTEVEPCPADPTLLCLDEEGTIENVEDLNGDDVELVDVVADPLEYALGSIERINTNSEGSAVSLQASSTAELFSRPNRFIIGASYDGGRVKYNTSSELGEIGNRFVVAGSGIVVGEPEDLAPRRLTTENDYFGVYSPTQWT